MEIQKEQEAFERFKAKQTGMDYETLKKDLDDCEKRFPNNRYAGWNFKSDWEVWQAATAQAVPDSPTEKTWDEIHLDPKERLYWSLRSAKKRKSDLNWSHASHQTCVGSTHGRKICEYLGVDPDGKDFVRTQEPAND